MLELRGRVVGLASETYTRKDNSQGVNHRLTVAIERGDPLVCTIRSEHFAALNGHVEVLRTFGQAVAIEVEPAHYWRYGEKVACVATTAPPVLVSEEGEVLTTAGV